MASPAAAGLGQSELPSFPDWLPPVDQVLEKGQEVVQGAKTWIGPLLEYDERGCPRVPPIGWAALVLASDVAMSAVVGKKMSWRWTMWKAIGVYLLRSWMGPVPPAPA